MTLNVRMGVHDFYFCCGVKEVGGFGLGPLHASPIPGSGTGFIVSTFINTVACKAAYDKLSSVKSVYAQTVPLRNRGGNEVFVVVFGPKKKPKKPVIEVQGTPTRRTAPQSTMFTRPGDKLPKL